MIDMTNQGSIYDTPVNKLEEIELIIYDDDDPLDDDAVEIPFFDSLEDFVAWSKKKDKTE
jgi:hypothetical protein